MKPFDATASLIRTGSGEPLYRHIRQAIETGQFQAGETLASTRALKQKFNISFHAVLTALNRLEREGWVVRRRGSGTYVRDITLNGNHRGVRKELLLLTSGTLNQIASLFLAPAAQAALDDLTARGVPVVTRQTNLGQGPMDIPCEQSAIIWMCPETPDALRLPARPPVVFVSHTCEALCFAEGCHDIITSDSRQGGALAGRYLREAGCTQAVFIGVDREGEWDIFSRLRLEGFEAGWGARLPETHRVRLGDYRTLAALEVAGEVLRRWKPPFGIFCASDDLAMGIVHGAVAHGVELGRDIRLVGFDGQPPRFRGDPALTTVSIPLEEMGRLAVRLALERAEAPEAPMRRISLGCSIRKGDTA